jgi:hypothetical protein
MNLDASCFDALPNKWLHLTAAMVFSEFCRKWPPQVSHQPFGSSACHRKVENSNLSNVVAQVEDA